MQALQLSLGGLFIEAEIDSLKAKHNKPDITIVLVHTEIELILDALNYYRKEVTKDKAQRWASNETNIMNGILEKMNIAQDRIIETLLNNFESEEIK